MQTSIFAPLFNRKHPSLSYGVMVALQFLVLSVVVRVRLGQHGKRTVIRPYAFFRTGIDAYHTGTRGSRNSEHTHYDTAKEPLRSGSFYLTMMKVSPLSVRK